MRFDPPSWRALGVIAALLIGLDWVVHRLREGTWAWEAGTWIPLVLGTLAGVGIVRVTYLWMDRRQRTRNRPST